MCHCYNGVMDVKLLYSITCVVHLHPSIGDSGIVASSAFWGFARCPAGCFIIIRGGGDVSSLSEGVGGYFIIIGGGGGCFIIIGGGGGIFHQRARGAQGGFLPSFFNSRLIQVVKIA